MKYMSLITTLLLSLSFNAQAALVTLQSTWKGWDPSLPDPYSSIGVFTFTYDDSTPGVSQFPPQPDGYTVDVYTNAITAATFVFENRAFTLDQSFDNSVAIAAHKYGGGGDIYMNMRFRDQSNVLFIGQFTIELYAVFTDTSLNNMIGVKADENGSFVYDPSLPHNFGHEAVQMLTPFTEVPLPAAAWSFGAALAGLVAMARRRLSA